MSKTRDTEASISISRSSALGGGQTATGQILAEGVARLGTYFSDSEPSVTDKVQREG
jgi:hypothetical protein